VKKLELKPIPPGAQAILDAQKKGMTWGRLRWVGDKGIDYLKGPEGYSVGLITNHGVDGYSWKAFTEGTTKTRREAKEEATGGAWSLVAWCKRQWRWSDETFGPGERTKGILEHIKKEMKEVVREPHDLDEWIDIVILGLDGFRRHGGSPEELIQRLDAKQQKNFARKWPDWRTMTEDDAIEHDRSEEVSRPARRKK
jgi:Protein of unknown function (DUF550)